MASDTLQSLLFWVEGSTNAEFMCVELAPLWNFKEVKPQSPFGGPDGKKDLLMKLNGEAWVGAAYFPVGEKTFKEIKDKFCADLTGARRYSPKGFAFFTNQRLSGAEITNLEKRGRSITVDVFHLTRVVPMLDSPAGVSIRRRYLRISVNEEERIAMDAANARVVQDALAQHSKAIQQFSHEMNWIKPYIEAAAGHRLQLNSPPLTASFDSLVQSGIANLTKPHP